MDQFMPGENSRIANITFNSSTIMVRCSQQIHPIFGSGGWVFWSTMSGSSHNQSVLICVEYRNYCQTLDVYLLFAIWLGQVQSKLIYIFVTYGLASL